ncbi:hypothetical protein L873DRAFT_1154442 [Choiromyces venosus 120613-1]|uniref:Secreted protein n=1 Tax=Choiromyces venosus 120613-1 TaxID=1336337 RepID=A0A3N4JFY2_9PEZI|nr:hypothetical protein L873DRAFT_1154442 [Choiromyces venosus 120613-1]
MPSFNSLWPKLCLLWTLYDSVARFTSAPTLFQATRSRRILRDNTVPFYKSDWPQVMDTSIIVAKPNRRYCGPLALALLAGEQRREVIECAQLLSLTNCDHRV